MEKSNYEVSILVNGKAVREYPHNDGLTYIEGRRGSNFSIRIRNNSFEEILAVPTVDGLSAMNGKKGNFSSGGYVINPYGHVDIPGWRLNNQEIAKFFFAELDKSYAAQMDQPDNVGVIGVGIFKKKKLPDMAYMFGDSLLTRGGSHQTYKSRTRGATKGIGTGFGERTEHRVHTVEFERATQRPFLIFAIHYDEREGLVERGINLKPVTNVANPFPGETGCTPPSGWRG